MNLKHILILSILCLVALPAWGQLSDEELLETATLDRVRAQRVAFITERINLTPREAETFWPLYNEYERKERQIRQRYRPMQRLEYLSDQEARELMVGRLDMEQELLDLKRSYYLRLADIISPRKLAGFARADREFKRMLLKQLQTNRRRNRD